MTDPPLPVSGAHRCWVGPVPGWKVGDSEQRGRGGSLHPCSAGPLCLGSQPGECVATEKAGIPGLEAQESVLVTLE